LGKEVSVNYLGLLLASGILDTLQKVFTSNARKQDAKAVSIRNLALYTNVTLG
jgi:hypothetical protein